MFTEHHGGLVSSHVTWHGFLILSERCGPCWLLAPPAVTAQTWTVTLCLLYTYLLQ